MIFGWVIIGVLLYYAFTGNGTLKTVNDNALSTLKRRYANGEIDEETYIKMKNVIK